MGRFTAAGKTIIGNAVAIYRNVADDERTALPTLGGVGRDVFLFTASAVNRNVRIQREATRKVNSKTNPNWRRGAYTGGLCKKMSSMIYGTANKQTQQPVGVRAAKASGEPIDEFGTVVLTNASRGRFTVLWRRPRDTS